MSFPLIEAKACIMQTIDLKDGQVTVETRTWWGQSSSAAELSRL